jgi:homoserine O-acetyltransferase
MKKTLLPNQEGDFTFAADEPFILTCGDQLSPVTLRYAIYGEINPRRDNVLLICHALSGSARVAEWWPEMFGPNLPFDSERWCVVGTNVLGSCYGSTGPASVNPATGERYGDQFPLVTIRDMVRAQALLLDYLGIQKVRRVIGGSIGGMQALQWAVDYPERIEGCVSIGTAPLSALGLALNHVQRQAIQNDPAWKGGSYDPANQPARGLALARQLAMCTYKSAELFSSRYGRNPNRNGENPYRSKSDRFDVAGYLDYQGENFVKRFDANSYIALSKAMDTFDLAQGYESERAALGRVSAPVLMIGISSDWLFPPEDARALTRRMSEAGVDAEYKELTSAHGHDAFLVELDQLSSILNPFLESSREEAA